MIWISVTGSPWNGIVTDSTIRRNNNRSSFIVNGTPSRPPVTSSRSWLRIFRI